MSPSEIQKEFAISCIGRDGVSRTFACTWNPDSSGGTALVTTVPRQVDGAFFEARYEVVDHGDLKQVFIGHHGRSVFTGMGIPDALLPRLATETGCDIVSSPRAGNPGEFRTPEVECMWERLRGKGIATYSSERDVFRISVRRS